uniref:DUF4301 family protein n=1 Tax=Desulfobacca acetoxidans TaxID=60893 RepID=A0A7C5ENB8_9BACT
MTEVSFSDEDLRQIQSHGLTLSQVREQLRFFARPPRPLRLNRPATPGDGIHLVSEKGRDRYLARQAEAASQGRFLKFVPASGGATRMFQVLLHYFYCEADELEAVLKEDLSRGKLQAREFLAFHQCLADFAFYPDLRSALAAKGQDLEELLSAGRYREILSVLLTASGLNYQDLPKALIKFHAYPDGSRTALEEHLVEAAAYVRDGNGVCRLHFTILDRHREAISQHLAEVQPLWESRLGCRFEVDFSPQRSITDTLAVDRHNRPFRDRNGRLVFRPGGHGALLDNLNNLQADLVYIKNIDNVVPDRLKAPTILWKKVLGGCLVDLQEKIHRHLRRLNTHPEDPDTLREALEFAQKQLFLQLSPTLLSWPPDLARHLLARLLNRPLRVCGVVPNKGEPGGAPFWVEEPDGSLSLQIVEKAEVDFSDPEQRAIWETASHFNPVDLVCALRDDQGVPFDLTQYQDPEAVFISTKYKDGQELKALELPGLWNGGMARWLTVFVEVPLITFNPVKTVMDLLRPEHQPRPEAA